MSEQITAAESSYSYADDEKIPEENQDRTKVVSISAGKLLKLKHKIKALKAEALHGYSQELKDIKSACNNTNALLGELNDGTGGNETS